MLKHKQMRKKGCNRQHGQYGESTMDDQNLSKHHQIEKESLLCKMDRDLIVSLVRVFMFLILTRFAIRLDKTK